MIRPAPCRTKILLTFAAFLAIAWPAPGQQGKSANAKSLSANPKCAFLRSENHRLAQQAQEFADTAPLARVTSLDELTAANGAIADWAGYVADSEVFAARRTILGMDVSACDRNIRLSDQSRLNLIENARASQVRRTMQHWQGFASDQGKDLADGIAAKINAVYEAETRTFFNPGIGAFDDPDVGKDYADLGPLIQNSALDPGTKSFYAGAIPHLRYEEAGRLADILRGDDKDQGLDYAYVLRKSLADRLTAVNATTAARANQQNEERMGQLMSVMERVLIAAVCLGLLLAILWVPLDRTRAKYRAFRMGLKRSPFWFGNAEWILWEPGETVVLLRYKQLITRGGRDGGFCSISAWKGDEYKGRISYKTQFSTWKSDPIITSDGLAVNLSIGIWWRIVDASLYVSKIASDYHEENQHKNENLGEAAEVWIKKLAAGTLREQVNQLPAEKLISPYVQAYLQVRSSSDPASATQEVPLPKFSDVLHDAQAQLNLKTSSYGIEIERLEVQELILPPVYQKKLEAVRVAFLEPTQAQALTKAQVIALEGLAGVIGRDKVGLIEVLKHVDLSHVSMNPFTGAVPIIQPVINTLSEQTAKALPEPDRDR